MLIFEDKKVIVDYELGFHRSDSVELEVDCALQSYFYCEECEAYTYHYKDICQVCEEVKECKKIEEIEKIKKL